MTFGFSLEDFKKYKLRKEIWDKLVKDPKVFGCANYFPTKRQCSSLSECGIIKAGDSVLFNGLLCYSGSRDGCKAVRDSQDKESGQWYRSPLHISREDLECNGVPQVPFSKDMFLGVLLYLCTTKDKEAAKKWYKWMHDEDPIEYVLKLSEDIIEDVMRFYNSLDSVQRNNYIIKYRDLCRDPLSFECISTTLFCLASPFMCMYMINKKIPDYLRLRVGSMCKHLDCMLWPIHYHMLYKVWNYIGLEPETNMKLFKRLNYGGSEDSLHLKAVYQLINKITGYEYREEVKKIVSSQPGNPLYQWLDGQSGSIIFRTLYKITDLDYDTYIIGPNEKWKGDQWTWERDTSENAQSDSMLWDFIFMHNLLINRFNEELEEYRRNVFPRELEYHNRDIEVSYKKLNNIYLSTSEFIKKLDALINEAKIMLGRTDKRSFPGYDELIELSIRIRDMQKANCPLNNLFWIRSYLEETKAKFDKLMDLKNQSFLIYYVTSKTDEHETFWNEIKDNYTYLNNFLDEVEAYLRRLPDLCSELSKISVAIAYKIEIGKIEHIRTDLENISMEIIEALKYEAKNDAKILYGNYVNNIAHNLSAELRDFRINDKYSEANQVSANSLNLFNEKINELIQKNEILSQEEIQTLVSEGEKILLDEIKAWNYWSTRIGPIEIIKNRAFNHNNKAMKFREAIKRLDKSKKVHVLEIWHSSNTSLGYKFPIIEKNIEEILDRDEFWMFNLELSSPIEDWIKFDLFLGKSMKILVSLQNESDSFERRFI